MHQVASPSAPRIKLCLTCSNTVVFSTLPSMISFVNSTFEASISCLDNGVSFSSSNSTCKENRVNILIAAIVGAIPVSLIVFLLAVYWVVLKKGMLRSDTSLGHRITQIQKLAKLFTSEVAVARLPPASLLLGLSTGLSTCLSTGFSTG